MIFLGVSCFNVKIFMHKYIKLYLYVRSDLHYNGTSEMYVPNNSMSSGSV